MQPKSCDDISLLISKYVDGETGPEERERVDLHVATCVACASKMREYLEFAAIMSEAPVRPAQPELRTNVFREIGNIKEEARRREKTPARKPWIKWLGGNVSTPSQRSANRTTTRHSNEHTNQPAGLLGAALGRLWQVAGPFAAASFALVALVVVILSSANRNAPTATQDPHVQSVDYQPVPTIEATLVQPPDSSGTHINGGNPQIPGPPATKLASPPPMASVSVIVQATATMQGGIVLQLEQQAPIAEDGAAWHLMRDPAYGYSLYYPSNWWTQARGDSRLFYPWGVGGTQYAPFRLDLRVEANSRHLDTTAANSQLFGGRGKLEPGAAGTGGWLRVNSGDDTSVRDELYAFDPDYVYVLRLTVPVQSPLGPFSDRWSAAQDVLSKMSSKAQFGGGPERVLFLDGGDLYSTSSTMAGDTRPVWRGYGKQWVRQFAASPDGQNVAFAATSNTDDLWARDLYVTPLDPSLASTARPLLSGEIHDIAWYSDRDLLAIASLDKGFGLYSITPDAQGGAPTVRLLAKLGDELAGARGLAVSPDRQLITFLAPLGSGKNTDIYAIRPDGSNLQRLVSHADATLPNTNSNSQAIKQYVWATGELESSNLSGAGYLYNLLYTQGNADSPTLYRGGSLLSAPNPAAGMLLDTSALGVADANAVQIVHLAYSPTGRVAFTGFYNLKGFKVETTAGLWTADLVSGRLANVKMLPLSGAEHGISDLQWSPDGASLIYRETTPSGPESFASRYDGHEPYSIISQDPNTGRKITLYSTTGR